MTNEEAKKMLEAKLKCLIAETSGTNYDCNMRLCDGCSLNYEQGNIGEQKQALDKAIKALEQQPNRCDNCIHSEEQDGSNCYECVKGMADNFEAQPKTGYISIDLNKFAKKVAEKALDEITYEGKTIREWAEILVKQQPSEDCISRQKALDCFEQTNTRQGAKYAIETLPSVTPRRDLAETSQDCISRESVRQKLQENYDFFVNAYGGFGNLPQSDKPRVDEIDNCIAIVVDEPPVIPQMKMGRWIVEQGDRETGYDGCIMCSECSAEGFQEWEYCPNCGSKMGVEENV